MPKKLQSFFVLKLTSKRLKTSNYKINLSLNDARRNGESVRLGDSELLRKIRQIRGIEFVQETFDLLSEQKKLIGSKRNTPENREEIRSISDLIDDILYVKDIIVVNISDVRHYKKIIDSGLYVNGKRYSRLLCGAGHARRSSVIFVSDEIRPELSEFLNCGRNLQEKINPNKFNAYYALASSATLSVTRPNFVVVPDYEINRTLNVDWFIANEDGIDPTFDERTLKQKTNLFDGQGLISPTQAQIWAEDVELDWLPSAFIFRAPFSKGLLVTFDFHKFAYENGIREITDIYGKQHLVDDIEVILSLSQFKMAGFYTDLKEYSEKCKQYDFGWGISRFSPKKDKAIANTTYQYLQAMNITDEKIEPICSPTKEWLKNISGLDWKDVSIFLLGERDAFEPDDFNSCDYLLKSILLEPDCMQDSFFRKKLLRLINKKIRESYTGILKVEGNYQFLVNDPYAQCQSVFGMEVTGLLKKGSAYSQYWNKKEIKNVSCFRSPMTWRSEQVVLSMDTRPNIWYDEYQYSNIIFNIHDDWLTRLSGADVDGDIVMTTPSFVDCHYENLNIPTYERLNAEKLVIDDNSLWKSDTLSFGSKIGLITNFGTTFFSMLSVFTDEVDQITLINRLKTCNVAQNMQIDKTKGITVYPIPSWWDKWNKDGDNMELYNKLLCRQRPYFMRYIYSSHNKKYKHHLLSYDTICLVRFGFNLVVLLETPDELLSEPERIVKEEFYTRSPLIDSSSIVNLICHYMESEVAEIKGAVKNPDFDYHIYMNSDFPIDEDKLHKMSILFDKYTALQRNRYDKPDNFESDDELPAKDEYIKILEREAYSISNNLSELTNLLVELCYGRHGENSKEFCWKMFGADGIVNNLYKNCNGFIQVPVMNENGTHKYLGKNYSLTNVVLGEQR
mgnify:CR=1 FL=1